MAVMTFEEMRGYLHSHGGEHHAWWCSSVTLCDGECTATAQVTTLDGQVITATVVLHHEAMWPTLTYTTADGRPCRLDPSRLGPGQYEAINQQVRVWNNGWSIPDPVCRPRPAVTAGGAR